MLSPSNSFSSFVSLPKIVSDMEGYGWLALVALWGSWSPGSPRDLVLPNGSPPFWVMFLFLEVPRCLAGPWYQCLAGYSSELLLFLGQWTHRCFLGNRISSQGLLAPWTTWGQAETPICLPKSCCFLSCRIFCRIPLYPLRQVLRAISPRQTGRYVQVLRSIPQVDRGHVPGTLGKLPKLSLPKILLLQNESNGNWC